MFHLIKNTSIIEQASQQFLQSHPCDYNFSREIIPLTSKNHNLRMMNDQLTTTIQIRNQLINNNIKLHFIKNLKNDQNCIVYLHGLSSYCLEGKFLIPYLANTFSLCLFDSRSHGKNNTQYVTYGLLQSLELLHILRNIVSKGYKNIILWGRSMGAVTSLRLIKQYSNDPVIQNIKYVVTDSPFGSFRMIATEIISKTTSLPQIVCRMLANGFSQNINQKYGIDLNQISLQNLDSNIPMTYFYSSTDEMIGSQHMELITSQYRGFKDICDTKMLHNEQRPCWIILKAFSRIYTSIKKHKKSDDEGKRKGLSITKINSNKYLSIITPSTTDIMRKSLRLVPPTQDNPRNSKTRDSIKQNEPQDYYRNPLKVARLAQSTIFSSISNSRQIQVERGSIKDRKNMINNYF